MMYYIEFTKTENGDFSLHGVNSRVVTKVICGLEMPSVDLVHKAIKELREGPHKKPYLSYVYFARGFFFKKKNHYQQNWHYYRVVIKFLTTDF